jgi:hypothetical protein
VHACPIAGNRVRSVRRRVLTLERPAPPFAAPFGVTARRHGRRIVVRWRTAFPARRVTYLVAAIRRRNSKELFTGAGRILNGRGRQRFRVVVRRPRHVRLRWVLVAAQQKDRPYRDRRVWVRVR